MQLLSHRWSRPSFNTQGVKPWGTAYAISEKLQLTFHLRLKPAPVCWIIYPESLCLRVADM